MYSLLFAHGVILGRRGYGPIGWGMPYDFADTDLHTSLQQLQEFIVTQPDQSPEKLFRHLILECNYGARITEQRDIRLLEAIILDSCSLAADGSALEDAYPRP